MMCAVTPNHDFGGSHAQRPYSTWMPCTDICVPFPVCQGEVRLLENHLGPVVQVFAATDWALRERIALPRDTARVARQPDVAVVERLPHRASSGSHCGQIILKDTQARPRWVSSARAMMRMRPSTAQLPAPTWVTTSSGPVSGNVRLDAMF